jgi:uridine kinase
MIRRMERDVIERGRSVQKIIEQYLRTVRPMHLQYVQPSKKNADIIVPFGLNSVALDLVISKLKRVLAESRWHSNADSPEEQEPPLSFPYLHLQNGLLPLANQQLPEHSSA